MRLLSEGIGHIDDLDVTEFIDVIKNIASYEISEKIDGSNLAFGLDENGEFYTTRNAKNKYAKFVYKASDYPQFSTYNGFRAAHLALETKVDQIKRVLKPNDAIEIEVVLGNQPNVVSYGKDGKNYVLFLRPLYDTERNNFNLLVSELSNTSVSIESEMIHSTDGQNLTTEKKSQTFHFSTPQKIKAASFLDNDVEKKLKGFEKFLSLSSGVDNYTNLELLQLPLSKIKNEDKENVKSKKYDLLSKVKSEFKIPIKQELLTKALRQLKSTIHSDEGNDIGIEGVVLLDPETGNQIKIVDKDTYTTVNQFNHAIRAQILGMIRNTDINAPIEEQGGLIGSMKIKIADLLGGKDLARGMNVKKALSKIDANTPKEKIVKFTKSLNLPEDFNGIKRKILSIVSATNRELETMRDDFKTSSEKYKLKLKTGKVIQLSPEVISRTLTTFAEAKAGIKLFFDKVKKTTTFEQIIAIQFGKYALDVETKINENLLLEKKYQTDTKMYEDKDAWTLLNIYFATVLASTVIYKADDKIGIRLLKDRAHSKLKAWSPVMSPLNFWGLVIWKSSSVYVKKIIGAKTAASLSKSISKVPKLWYLNLHLSYSAGNDAPFRWEEHLACIRRLQWHPNMKIDRINFLVEHAFNYENLSFDEKVKFINKLYFYIRQFVPSSPLLLRINKIQTELLINPVGKQKDVNMVGESLLKEVNVIVEDDADTATSSGDIATVDSRINKTIIRRKRNLNLNFGRNTFLKLKRFK